MFRAPARNKVTLSETFSMPDRKKDAIRYMSSAPSQNKVTMCYTSRVLAWSSYTVLQMDQSWNINETSLKPEVPVTPGPILRYRTITCKTKYLPVGLLRGWRKSGSSSATPPFLFRFFLFFFFPSSSPSAPPPTSLPSPPPPVGGVWSMAHAVWNKLTLSWSSNELVHVAKNHAY